MLSNICIRDSVKTTGFGRPQTKDNSNLFIYEVLPVAWWVDQNSGKLGRKLALVSSNLFNQQQQICNHYQFWTKSQRTLCMKFTELIPKVAEGAEMAYDECRHQFRWRRWNCAAKKPVLTNNVWTYETNEYPSLFGEDFEPGGIEASFVNAIFSSGVAYSITKACSSNKLEGCSCERNKDGTITKTTTTKTTTAHHLSNGFQWHQCNDNVMFGLSFAKKFIDSVELNWNPDRMFTTHAQVMMNLHNNKVGRMLLKENLQQNCVCHGVSGTCSTQVCSKRLGPYRDIGGLLRKRTEKAIKVTLKYINTHRILMPADNQLAPVTDTDLIYLKSSPSYCNKTTGRRCKLNSKKKAKKKPRGGCDMMCCGAGYRTKLRTVTKNCKCQFIWCCKVTCEKCYHQQKVHSCK
eukprot:TCONS_00065525-protein